MSNKKVVAIIGRPSSGKSYSLKYLHNPKTVVYFNCDIKDLPFKAKFAANMEITDPEDLLDYLDDCEGNEDVKTIVIDTITYLMRTYKTLYIDEATDTRSAWGNYGKYYNKLLLRLKSSSKNVIVLAHVDEETDEDNGNTISKMVLQGAAGKSSEGDYTTIVECKSKTLNKKLTKYKNPLLKFTDWEKEDGIKYVFVTRKTKNEPNTLARSAGDLWEREMLYIDNSIQHLIDRLEEYYD